MLIKVINEYQVARFYGPQCTPCSQKCSFLFSHITSRKRMKLNKNFSQYSGENAVPDTIPKIIYLFVKYVLLTAIKLDISNSTNTTMGFTTENKHFTN